MNVSSKIGVIGSISQAFIWTFNLFRYLGWGGVIVGVGLAIFSLIYKLFSGDSEAAMKVVQGYITKAVIIVVAGILLISAGFIVEQVSALIGIKESLTVENIGAIQLPVAGTCKAVWIASAGCTIDQSQSNCGPLSSPTVSGQTQITCTCTCP